HFARNRKVNNNSSAESRFHGTRTCALSQVNRLAHGLGDRDKPVICTSVAWDASSGAKATSDADSPGQLATPAPVPGRGQTGDCISSYVSGAPKELLHAWQEGSTPDR